MPQFGITNLQKILLRVPEARAVVHGSPTYPNILGLVSFYQTTDGVVLVAQVQGLPYGPDPCYANVFAFHIHQGTSCTGNSQDPFANVGYHYNPEGCMHPEHAGDLPPLFGNQGYAFMAFLTDRFTVEEVIGHIVIIHASPDDFTTQPSGNAGIKMACGEITPAGILFQ